MNFLRAATADVGHFSRALLRRPLRHYQLQAARAICRSVARREGRVFTVTMARQMGKNELSAQLEAYLLYLHWQAGGAIVKTAPTFHPQLVTSKSRLERVLAGLPIRTGWHSRHGYIVELGAASVQFLSAGDDSNVVGATASLLLEVDEAQDVSEEKYLRDFRPMGATANVTTVLYGTAWSSDGLLASHRAANLHDDPEAHFEFPWTVLAELNPAYKAYVSGEIRRLGADHPIIKTQYLLEPLDSAGRLFNPDQLLSLQGTHPRTYSPSSGRGGGWGEELTLINESSRSAAGRSAYVAGIDIAGETESHTSDQAVRRTNKRRDSTVVTIARVTHPPNFLGEPLIEVVQHYWWTGRDHSTQYTALLDLLQDRWHCQAVCVDATGVGAGVASWLARAMQPRVEQVQFTRPLKSDLGYELLAAANAARLKMYANDASPDWSEFWHQVRECRSVISQSATMNFFVDPAHGHDDFVVSLALCVRAASHLLPEPYGVLIQPPALYADGRY